ncbi:retropepsin-like aspartic protease family protein [Sphingomonas silueang]|uniref:retropepsin-like aspartic protease family protein n=1 Tax=Sphingomonas silueang TaxID=3156617 RepID=UPI0032B4A7A2
MTGDRLPWIVLGLLMLMLPLSSLIARRPSAGVVVRNLLGWVAVFGILYVAFAHRVQLGQWASDLSRRIGVEEQTVDGDTVRIRQSPDGHFWANVRLNGVERRMLIDSGATTTAISEETARKAGITIRRVPPVILNTANGAIEASRGRVETLRLGSLETRDLPVVVSPTFGAFDVIGMNFLSRLDSWRVERGMLVLEGSDGRRSPPKAP